MRFGFGPGDDVAEEFLQAADAAQRAFRCVGQGGVGDGLELRQSATQVRQAANGMPGLEQPRAAAKIEDGAVEDEEELAPGLAGAGAISVRNFGKNEEEVAGLALRDGQRARFHAAAAVQQVDQSVLAKDSGPMKGNTGTVTKKTGNGDLSQLSIDPGLENQARAAHGVRHPKTYMFLTIESMGEEAPFC